MALLVIRLGMQKIQLNETYGKLLVTSQCERPAHRKDISHKFYQVECVDCAKKYVAETGAIKKNKDGCADCQRKKAKPLRHGEATQGGRTKEYRTWLGIKTRCTNSNTTYYYNYGGRGIKMSQEWQDSYETFLADMGRAPSSLHQIERKDVNGDYCKKNCCWATAEDQMKNLRKTVRVILPGNKSMTIKEACERYSIPREALKDYVLRRTNSGIKATYTEALYLAILDKNGIKL
jgi:hypothetical protein